MNESSCGKPQPRSFNFRLNGVRSEHGQDAVLVNGTLYHEKINCAYGPRIQPVQAAAHYGKKVKQGVNGYTSRGLRNKRTETSGVSTIPDQKSHAQSRAEQHQSNAATFMNGARGLEKQLVTTATCNKKSEMLDSQTATKSQRKKKKPWHFKRKKVDYCENLVPQTPDDWEDENLVPQTPEDWEDEIQEIKISNWEKMSFGPQPYGPEDVVTFALRDLSLERTKLPLWHLTNNKYLPVAHHQQPIDWRRCQLPSEPGQFSDVED